MNIEPGLFEALSSKEGQYLSYIIDQYEKLIKLPYDSIFVGRAASLNILLEKEFSDAKDSADINVSLIKELFNSLDVMNIQDHQEELEGIAAEIDNLSHYLKYLMEKNSEQVALSVAQEIIEFKLKYNYKNYKKK